MGRTRTMSASPTCQTSPHLVRNEQRREQRRERRHTCSAAVRGGAELGSALLPGQTLLASLEVVYRTHVVTDGEVEEEEVEAFNTASHQKLLRAPRETNSQERLLAYLKEKSFPWNLGTSTCTVETSSGDRGCVNSRHQQASCTLEEDHSKRSWALNSFCYECGRSAGIRLTQCSGCRLVAFCSQSCREQCLKAGHRSECMDARVAAKQRLLCSQTCRTRTEMRK